jgi:mono/diheme cytochrome c family protein
MGWIAGMLAAAVFATQGEPAPRAATGPAALEPVEYNRDIRAILSDHCYQCHGPDGGKRKAGLRLDQESSAKADRDGIRAIVPGDVESSALYERITAVDASQRMPPVKSGKSLSAGQIDLLRRWISEGAKWQPPWAFMPPRPTPLPRVRNGAVLRNPIDAFIQARLEQERLTPAGESDRGILIRRVSLDLTGLPPTGAEIDAFERDASPDAYEKVVDRLLASPRLGERLAIRWLNAARYADTNGYQTDAPRFMWRWRDWVIEAYNRNQPFDRFTIEQLAGDMLPGSTLDQKLATGFNRNHRGNGEGGIIPEEYAVEYVVDRVDTTATVWLGLTIACARCHSHKFDPITQDEFYRFFALFNNVPENGRAIKFGNSPPMIKTPTRAQQRELDRLKDRLAGVEEKVKASEGEIIAAQSAWEAIARARPRFDWTLEQHLVARCDFEESLASGDRPREALDWCGEGQPSFVPRSSGSALALDGRGYLDMGDIAGFGFYDRFTISAWIKPGGPRGGTIVSRMVDEPQGEGYSVALEQGNVHVNLVKRWLDDAIRVATVPAVPSGKWTHLTVTYDGSRLAAGVKVYLDGRPVPLRVALDELNQTFQTKQPLRIGAGGGPASRFDGSIDQLCVHNTALAAEDVSVLATPEAISEILQIAPQSRTIGQVRKVRGCFLKIGATASVRALTGELNAARAAVAGLSDAIPTTMVMEELAARRATHVLYRGQYDQPRTPVGPGIPACLGAGSKPEVLDRLGLARWLVAPGNPLTARVAVNRDWQMLFGTGLLKTVDDFGAQSEPASHPELLDWLAVEFVESGWDVKRMLRLIATSGVYRRSSKKTSEGLERDPENRLLAHAPRLRLSAEMIRDQALMLAGLLVERTGGPSVKPYQPAGLWNELADADYVQDHGASLYRRSLYTFWKRTVPPPAMVAFDAPARETCTVRESRTNTPLQALDVLNDVTFVEAARGFAERIMSGPDRSPQARLSAAFHLATARRPRPEEIRILLDGFHDQLARFRREPGSAQTLIKAGESKSDPHLDPVELAAYTGIAQLILNLDETLTKE